MLRLYLALLALLLAAGGSARAADVVSPTPSPSPSNEARVQDDGLIDAGLEALAAGDLPQARAAFAQAAAQATTPAARATAAWLATRVDALAARRRSSAAASNPEPAEDLARAPFLVTTTGLGLAVWGWTLPIAMGLDAGQNTRAFVGIYMVTAAGSFVLPYFLTRAAPPTWGETNLAFYGGTRGAAFGATLSALTFGRHFSDTSQNLAAGAVFGSVAGLFGGQLWAAAEHMTPGRARTIAFMGDAGMLTGFAIGHMSGLNDSDLSSDARARGMAAAGLGGAVGGLLGGRLLAARRHNTWGDGEVTRATGLLGVFTGATVAFIFDYQDRSKPTVATLTAGGVLGLAGGDLLVRDADYTFGQSILVDLALLSGGLGAAGLTYLVHQFDGPRPYMVAGALGGGLGLGLSAWAFRGEHGRLHATTSRSRATRAPNLALVPRLGPTGERGFGVIGRF